jgi:hypothetical protein
LALVVTNGARASLQSKVGASVEVLVIVFNICTFFIKGASRPRADAAKME